MHHDGKPKMTDYGEMSLNIRVSASLKRWLAKEAKKQERTISQLVRFILIERQNEKGVRRG